MNSRTRAVSLAANDQIRKQRLIGLIIDLKEEECLAEIKNMLTFGWDPMDLLEICIEGLQGVGRLFEQGRYFIAALIMAGEIMRRSTEILGPRFMSDGHYKAIGSILLGTIAGDIHDLGKNLFAILARCHGIKVMDLGVDVPVSAFVEQARRTKPDLVGISCVRTTAVPELKEAVTRIRLELPSPRPVIIIGGTCIDATINNHVQADYWAADAAQGVKICQRIIAVKNKSLT